MGNNSMKENIKGFLQNNAMVFVLFVVFIFFNILTNGKMLYAQNISNLLVQNAHVIILACGMLLCILTGGNIDLSIGCTVCLSGAIAGKLLENSGMSPLAVVLISMFAAILVGIWNGAWIGYGKIPPFIVTLASMFMVRGLARAVIDSKTVLVVNNDFNSWFTSYINIPGLDDGLVKYSAIAFGIIACIVLIFSTYSSYKAQVVAKNDKSIPHENIQKLCVVMVFFLLCSWKLANCDGLSVLILWAVFIAYIYNFFTEKMKWGRYFYAVGGNEKATKLSGINTKLVYFWAYVQVAFLSGLCGLLTASRIGSVNGDMGTQYEMDAIASCFIGGASAYGGSGTVKGAVIGAILMGIINQGMSIYGLNTNWQYVVKGIVLLLAIVFAQMVKTEGK